MLRMASNGTLIGDCVAESWNFAEEQERFYRARGFGPYIDALEPIAARLVDAPDAPETEEAIRALQMPAALDVYFVAGFVAKRRAVAERRRDLAAMLPEAARPRKTP